MTIKRVPRDLGVGQAADHLARQPRETRTIVICGYAVENHLREVAGPHTIFLNPSNRAEVVDLEVNAIRVNPDELIVAV